MTAKTKSSGKRSIKRSRKRSTARLERIQQVLARTYPDPTTDLRWDSPLELLLATILSAQCTDVRVNKVTPRLFSTFPTAVALAEAPAEEIEQIIRSTGFFRAKARSIQGTCRALVERHNSEVPADMDLLLELPGVARKTANVVLGTAFGVAAGVVVDTHVKRLSGRLGFTSEKDPKKIELDLMDLVPRDHWIDFGHQLVLHGRALCKARKPLCDLCPLARDCPSRLTGP